MKILDAPMGFEPTYNRFAGDHLAIRSRSENNTFTMSLQLIITQCRTCCQAQQEYSKGNSIRTAQGQCTAIHIL